MRITTRTIRRLPRGCAREEAKGMVTDRLLTAEELQRLTGRIYVLETDARGPIKIGFTSKSVPRRRRALQTGQPMPLRVAWYGPGTILDEQRIHHLLAPSRLEGEWFARTDIVRIALDLLPIYGAEWVGKLETNMLLTFVPTRGCGVPLWHMIGHYPPRETYWPEWSSVP